MELDEISAVIASASFFTICDVDQQRLLAFASERRQFGTGDIVYSHGDPADGAYVLLRGRVAVTDDLQRPDKTYDVSGPDVMFGELALVLDRPRRTSVKAITEIDTLFVPRMAFVKLMRQYPDLVERAATRIEEELGTYLGRLDKFRARPPQQQ